MAVRVKLGLELCQKIPKVTPTLDEPGLCHQLCNTYQPQPSNYKGQLLHLTWTDKTHTGEHNPEDFHLCIQLRTTENVCILKDQTALFVSIMLYPCSSLAIRLMHNLPHMKSTSSIKWIGYNIQKDILLVIAIQPSYIKIQPLRRWTGKKPKSLREKDRSNIQQTLYRLL